MTTTEQAPVERTPAPTPPSRFRKGIIAAAVALAIAGGGGAAVYASSGSSSSSAIGQAPAGMGQPPNGGGEDALADVAHGELQTGTVTAITSASVTAESTDGYSRTYVIDAGTVFAASTPGAAAGTATDVAEGDTITVVATTSGGTATAVRISGTT